MRLRHFEELKPVCPVCRGADWQPRRLQLVEVAKGDEHVVEQGLLNCENPACRREYPILDGIPVLVADLRGYVDGNVTQMLMREDLSPLLESVIGDCAGPGSAFDVVRQHLSMYGVGHYGAGGPALARILDRADELGAGLGGGAAAGTPEPDGPAIDLGCSVGRSSFELASRRDGLVLGVDLNFAMLRAAQQALRTGVARFSQRRVGVVFDPVEVPVDCPRPENVDFWACDVSALPFEAGGFSRAVALNLLDCVQSPVALLHSIASALRPGGTAVVATPYDWSTTATPLEQWVGGHSQRAEHRGRGEPMLRALFTPGAHPASSPAFRIRGEDEHLPWAVALHDRSTASYSVHLVVADRLPEDEPTGDAPTGPARP